MPRNSAGVYSVPNVFTPNTVISSTQVNANFSDAGTALTDSLDRQGRGGMQANLDLGGFRGVNSADPQSDTDLVTRQWAANANNLTTGTIPDARLSANIPRLDAINHFTRTLNAPLAYSIFLDATTPALAWYAAGAPLNNRLWDVVPVGTQLLLRALNDIGNTSTNWGSVSRSGNTITNITFGATEILLNSGNVSGGAIRATGVAAFATGIGAEMEVSGTDAFFSGFNRSMGVFINTHFRGANVLLESNGSGTVQYNGREVGYRGAEARTATSPTLQQSDNGRVVVVTSGNVTVPPLAENTLVTVLNNSGGAITLVRSGTALFLAGTTNNADRTLARLGIATLFWYAGTTNIVASGAGLT